MLGGKASPQREPGAAPNWPDGAPHHTSHWATIFSRHSDPPPRLEVRPVGQMLGRQGPAAGRVWGGAHE